MSTMKTQLGMRESIDIVAEGEALFEMSNLTGDDTGLPFVVWLSPKGGARHDVRVKVSPNLKAMEAEMVSVALRPTIRDLSGTISGKNMKLLERWIVLNEDTILAYWNSEISTSQMLKSIKHI